MVPGLHRRDEWSQAQVQFRRGRKISRFTELWLTFSYCGWTRFGDVSRSQSCMNMGASKEYEGRGV
jgi:hypothetical protein